VVGIVIAATAAASAAVPSLPPQTAAQLLATVGRAAQQPPGPYTATVQQTANLGLPQLSVATQAEPSSSLTSGTQSLDIWYANPQHVRVAVPVQAGESDARLDGRTLWLWNSKNQTATKVTLPTHSSSGHDGNGVTASGSSSAGAPSMAVTPQAVASELLRAIGPTTVVGVQSPVYVANRPAYQLSLAPKSSQSLVSQVLIAIDASRGIPLRVEVYGRGGTGLAYSLGFTSLSFGTPAAANFSFTPPPGATVKTEVGPANPGSLFNGLGVAGGLPDYPQRAPASASTSTPTVIGSSWLSVVATPASPDVAAAVRQLLAAQRTAGSSDDQGGFFGSSSAAAPGPSASGQPAVPVGPYLAPLQTLLVASTRVSGSWGSGRLLQTALVSVLVTSTGQILVGAVSPSVLYADVAQDGG
jgi:outer membrane lipoprotein-sorting protein